MYPTTSLHFWAQRLAVPINQCVHPAFLHQGRFRFRFSNSSSSRGQPPGYIDDATSGGEMGQAPHRSDVKQVRRIIHQRLEDDMQTQQVDEALIAGGAGLRKSRGEHEPWEHLHEVVVGTPHAERQAKHVIYMSSRRCEVFVSIEMCSKGIMSHFIQVLTAVLEAVSSAHRLPGDASCSSGTERHENVEGAERGNGPVLRHARGAWDKRDE